MANGRFLSVTPFVFSAAATGASLVAADLTRVLGGKGSLLLALGAGASLRMFRVPVGSNHLSPFVGWGLAVFRDRVVHGQGHRHAAANHRLALDAALGVRQHRRHGALHHRAPALGAVRTPARRVAELAWQAGS